MRKKVLVLGSTGSIGRATLDVIAAQEDRFQVSGLLCRENLDLLSTQIERFKPEGVCSVNGSAGSSRKKGNMQWLRGMAGIGEMIRSADIVVNALPGSAGLEPTIMSLKQGKLLALANKESLVMAGRIITNLLKSGKCGRMIPVDSEHSALYQLLKPLEGKEVKRITITASGGPFRDYPKEALPRVTVSQALNHPTWKMGSKITLDSATLMNKGLEVIEAKWLFNVEADRIKVIVHPESIIHGIVELVDGAFLAHMAYPDMRIPISYALNEETRFPLPLASLSLEEKGSLSFFAPDTDRFPCLRLAYEALESGDSALVVLNVANEAASQAFIEGRIGFTGIPRLIEEVLQHHPCAPVIETLEGVQEIQRWTEEFTEERLKKTYG